jgi:rSAM/selenodomain-associated transferase 2/rSAM/selenodomain-associated transferase 1
MPDAELILIFARYPKSGEAKTRLIPELGAAGAARLHRRMTEHIVAASRKTGAPITVCYAGAQRSAFRAWLGTDLDFVLQPPGDLGARLLHAFNKAFRQGATRVIAVGSDVPDVNTDRLRNALAALHDHDVALGPASDGGYYLIGMKRLHSTLFTGMAWGSARVADQTRAAIRQAGIRSVELPALADVDVPADLPPLRQDLRFADVFTHKPRLSVIIAALNEEQTLGLTLERIRGAEDIEIIVADGGSNDATRNIATRSGASVLDIRGGRAAQWNAGAARATGRHLLFLHADTLVPEHYADLIRTALDEPSVVAGAFRFKTDGEGLALRLVEIGANMRSSLFRWPYGDQGLFMDKRIFNELGGFAPLPIMEDFELVQRLRRRGRVVTLSEAAITSARRWMSLGAIRTTLRNQFMVAGFLLGIAPARIVRLYRRDAAARP